MSSNGGSCPSICSAAVRPCVAPSSAARRRSASRHHGAATSRDSRARAVPFSSTDDPACPALHPRLPRVGGCAHPGSGAAFHRRLAGCDARLGRTRHACHSGNRARPRRRGHGRGEIRERAVSLDAMVGSRLVSGLEEAVGRRILVATDHEGGRIIMLGRAVTIFPDNLAAGAAGEVNFVHRQGLIEGRELRRLGVDVNFSPVLDVLTERYSPNIGIRSYGKDPALVARYGAARIRGLQSAGVSACAKHFPGKGHAPLDAHLALPMIGSEWSEMHATHLPPFLAAIAAGVDCIMTSHPLYPRLDPAPRTPATFSRLIVEDFLRGETGYRGVIVSDDLEMGAIGEICPVGDATVRAAAAGHDLLLVCHTPVRQREAHAALLEDRKSTRLNSSH